MDYFVSTGELSGDLHLSYLVTEIKKVDKDARFYGVAGKNSRAVGVNIIQDIEDLGIMGFVEIFKKISFFKKKLNEYVDFILKNKIKKVILVDYGGFNLKLLSKIKKEDSSIEVYYYIPPKVWFWGKKRVHKIAKADKVLTIFPWEVDFYKNYNYKAYYYGNPFMERYEPLKRIGDKILLLPGSRRSEVNLLMPELIKLIQSKPEEKFIIRFADKSNLNWFDEDLSKYKNLELEFDKTLKEIGTNVKYAIAASGTVILELCLLAIPGIAIYKTAKLNWFVANSLIDYKYVTLPNLSIDKTVYEELLQDRCNLDNILKSIDDLEKNIKNKNLLIEEVRSILGGKDIVLNYAKEIVNG